VSRSYLQTNTYVSKVSAHIVKKVCDSLNGLFNNDRARYEAIWGDIKTFIEYGCMRDGKFYDRLKENVLYSDTEGKLATLDECLAGLSADDKGEYTVYYTSDATAQAVYVNVHKRAGRKVLAVDNMIETQFLSLVEMQGTKDENKGKIKFVRVDAQLAGEKGSKDEGGDAERLAALFREAAGDPDLKVEARALDDPGAPAFFTMSEQTRRMADIMRQYRQMDANVPPPPEYAETLVVNTSCPVVAKLLSAAPEAASAAAKQIYMLALLNLRRLEADELQAFMDGSVALLEKVLE